jgi:hypothetical protein
VASSPGVIVIERSEDAKLSDPDGFGVSATYVAQQTCPADCPLMDAGCYAETGNVGIHTRRLNQQAKEAR